jgi:hypothetical protein
VASAQRTLLSLYYSSPFADGGFLDQLQDAVVDEDERRPLVAASTSSSAAASGHSHGAPSSETTTTTTTTTTTAAPIQAETRKKEYEEQREYKVYDVVKNLVDPRPAPPPAAQELITGSALDLEFGMEHADDDDPILASLRQTTQRSEPQRASPPLQPPQNSFYAQSVSNSSPLPIDGSVESSVVTGRYATDTDESRAAALPARVEPGLEDVQAALLSGWNKFKVEATTKFEAVKARVNNRDGSYTSVPAQASTPEPASASSARGFFSASFSNNSSSDPPVVQSNVVVPPSRGPISILCGGCCTLVKAFCRQDMYTKQIILFSMFALWVVYKLMLYQS